MARRPKQMEMRFPKRGGRRKGAGRKPKGDKAGVPHRARPAFAARYPLHVTVRVAEHVYSLRSRRSRNAIKPAIFCEKSDFRVCHYSIQGNHIHMLVEARGRRALMGGMKGFSVRVAKRMNRVMGRRGQVIGDRYHSRVLRTPSEVRNALNYLWTNAREHYGLRGEDEFSSVALPPETWLLGRAGP